MSESKPQSLPAPKSKGFLLAGATLVLAGYALAIVHHWLVTKGIAIQPAIRASLALLLGTFALRGNRAATWILLLLCIPWFVESIVAATRPNMEWIARLVPAGRGILTAAGGFFLWHAAVAQKKEWLGQMFKEDNLHKASMVFDPSHDEPFLERISHLFDVGFGKLQIKEILGLCKHLGKGEEKACLFTPYYFRQKVPLRISLARDATNSLDIRFFTTRELANRIEERKETYMETLGVK